mmetsp:Transcript_57586/g.171370  ORF Transcript_57586/g.171370 Transcript_57586/m.171370 type:complete len:251 (+) Transcript_57586:105-857(+)
MDKYRRVEKPKEAPVKDDEEIRVTATGSVSAYVSRAATVFQELEKKMVVIKATGNALAKAVTLAEVVKRRFKGLHQITSLGSMDIVDEYEPLEEGLDKVTDTRTVSLVEIKLSKESLDSSDKGYQAPIDESLVTEFDAEELSKPRGRGRGKGAGRGKGKGKGKKGMSTEKMAAKDGAMVESTGKKQTFNDSDDDDDDDEPAPKKKAAPAKKPMEEEDDSSDEPGGKAGSKAEDVSWLIPRKKRRTRKSKH